MNNRDRRHFRKTDKGYTLYAPIGNITWLAVSDEAIALRAHGQAKRIGAIYCGLFFIILITMYQLTMAFYLKALIILTLGAVGLFVYYFAAIVHLGKYGYYKKSKHGDMIR